MEIPPSLQGSEVRRELGLCRVGTLNTLSGLRARSCGFSPGRATTIHLALSKHPLVLGPHSPQLCKVGLGEDLTGDLCMLT